MMDRFYQELQHHSPAVALRNAQVTVRELTMVQIADTLAQWRTQSSALAEVIDDPHQFLEDLSSITRQTASREPASGVSQAGMLPPPDAYGVSYHPLSQPFAAPLLWAPFMVIGRA
jgi:CHAT domain-containing protein